MLALLVLMESHTSTAGQNSLHSAVKLCLCGNFLRAKIKQRRGRPAGRPRACREITQLTALTPPTMKAADVKALLAAEVRAPTRGRAASAIKIQRRRVSNKSHRIAANNAGICE